MPGLLIEAKGRGLSPEEAEQERRGLVLSYRQSHPQALQPQQEWDEARRQVKARSRGRTEQRLLAARAKAKAELEATISAIQAEEQDRLQRELAAVGAAPAARPTEKELNEWRALIQRHWGRDLPTSRFFRRQEKR